MSMYSQQTSKNFSTAKACALLMVISGHFFSIAILWVPVSIGLTIFAFSSGYFTAFKYPAGSYDIAGYWKNKMIRLGGRAIGINIFLILLLSLQGHLKDLLTWHTIIHITGGSGFLNWFGIQDQSPLGAGLWFFTLLLIFYSCYPVLNRFLNSQQFLKLAFGAIVAVSAQQLFPMGHSIWLTSFSFLAGIAMARYAFTSFPFIPATILLTASGAAITTCHFLNIHSANTALLLMFSFALCVLLIQIPLPHLPLAMERFINKYMLEIYFIHHYLFIRPFGNEALDFFCSLALIFVTASLLHTAIMLLQKKLIPEPKSC